MLGGELAHQRRDVRGARRVPPAAVRRRSAVAASALPLVDARPPGCGLGLGLRLGCSGSACDFGSRLGFCGLGRFWARAPARPAPAPASELGGFSSAPGRASADASPITASWPPTSTVSSSPAVISRSVPATGEGISVSTLSVDTSSSGSSTSTWSPTCLSQRVTVPSVTLSPSSGIFTAGAGAGRLRLGLRLRCGLVRIARGLAAATTPGRRRGVLLLAGVLARPRVLAPSASDRVSELGVRPAVVRAVTDHGQLAADLDGLVLPRDDPLQHPRRGGGDLGVDLVGGDLEQRLVDLDPVALLLEPPGDGALGDALTEGGHLDGEGHGGSKLLCRAGG